MPRFKERGVIQFIVLLILLAGLVAGVYLVQRTQIFKPKATSVIPLETSFTLTSQQPNYQSGDLIETSLMVRSDILEANLFVAKLNFNKSLLAVDRIDTQNTFITNWIENHVDEATATISISGGVPSPGFRTTGQPSALMAKIYFRALKTGPTAITFANTSAIYSNDNNVNILTTKRDLNISIEREREETPTPTPTPTPPSTGTVQGYKVLMPGNTQGEPASSQTVTIDGTLPLTANPYFYNGVPAGDHTLFVTVPAGWSVGYTLCYNRTDCHNDTPSVSREREEREVDLGINVPAGGYADLWWHFYPLPSPTPTPTDRDRERTPTPTPTDRDRGDVNNDSQVNLVDFSILLSDFNKTSGFRQGADINNDNAVNSFDFSSMRNLLIQKGVIQGN